MSIEKIPYAIMLEQLAQMSKSEINRHLELLGCLWDYDKISLQLSKTYNDLQVADDIFQNFSIQEEKSPYGKSFIDEAVFEIVSRESFTFTHYGLLSREILELRDQLDDEACLLKMEASYRSLFKLAKQFSLTSMEGLVYQVNDGTDLVAIVAEMLDHMQQKAREDHAYAKKIVEFVDKFLKIFTKTNPFTKVMLQYEQAQAYIVLRSSKGEQLFRSLLKTHSDPTDVVLHYGLAYIDDDPRRTGKIFKQYVRLLDPKSESYEVIAEIQEDLERRNHEKA